MHSLNFNDFSDSPVIILSPHQHQFDPISRAAHSLYQPTTKPIMDRRPYDVPIAAEHARKRSHDDLGAAQAVSTGLEVPQAASTCPILEQSSSITMHGRDFRSRRETMSRTVVAGSAGTHIEEPINEVDVPASTTESSEDTPRRKITRQITAVDVGAGDSLNDPDSSPIADDIKIDEYARLLGIGWAMPGDESAVAAAMRGFHRFIENNFPLTNVKIAAQNKKDLLNLVQSVEGWFLFTDDLKAGQLLARKRAQAVSNLMHKPPKFEGETMIYQYESASGMNAPIPPSSSTGMTSRESDKALIFGVMDID